jgi:hypothetical protein
LVWRWMTDGQYSARSCYDTLFWGRSSQGPGSLTGNPPPRVKFFFWLACLDRCCTGERLARRGLPHAPRCPLCDQSVETMRHLLTGCSFFGLRSCRGSDPPQALPRLGATSRSGGCWWYGPPIANCVRALRRLSGLRHGGFGSTVARRSSRTHGLR